MARNLFGPMGVFSTPADRLAQQPAQSAPTTVGQPVQPDSSAIAQKYRIPRNILQVYEERGEDPEEAARKITAELDAGKSFEDIVPKAVRIRASDIADEIRGVQPKGGFGKAVGVGVDSIQQSIGSAVEGLGRSTGIEGLQTYGARVAEDNAAEAASGARGLTGLGDIDGIGSAGSYVSELAGQQAPQMGVSLAGAGAGALAGSAFGPVGTVVGGIAGGLASSIPLFYGQNRERQKEAMAAEGVPVQVDEGAAFLTSLPQAGLDTFANLLAASGVGIGAKVLAQGGGVLTRRVMLQAAGEGAKRGVIAEVPTEIGQAVLERAQAGLPLFDEEAIAEYIDNGVAAGILGGGLGAGGGVMDVRSEARKAALADPADPAQPEPLLLPSPTSGGTIFGQPPANTNPGADGSGVGQGAAPGMAPPGASGAAPVEPMGVLGRAAQAAPNLTPQPQAAPLFPDMKPGAKVVLADPGTGELIDATFQREENGIPIVRINGVEQPIPPQMFDMAVNAGQKAVGATKAGKGGLATAATPKAPRPVAPEPDLNALSLEEAQARLTDLDEKIRIAAKPSKKMIETRARLIDVVDRKQGGANAAVQPDGGAGVQPVAPVQGGDTAGSGPDPVASVQGQGLPPAPASSGAEGVAGAAAKPQQGEALTQGAPSRVVGENPVERAQRDIEQKRARLAEIEAGLTDEQRATVKRVVDQAPEPDRWAARRGALSAFAGEAEPLLQPTSKDDTRAFRAAQKAAQQAAAPRAPAAPITTPPSEQEDAFTKAGYRPGGDPSTRVLEVSDKNGHTGKYVVRPVGNEGRFKVVKTTDKVGSIAIPTRNIGVFESQEAALAAIDADRGIALTPKADQTPQRVSAPAYGAGNKLVTAARADEVRRKLQDKLKNQLNSGIDPEILSLGTELAVFHIEAGVRRFGDFARTLAADLGSTPDKLRPYLRGWYLGAKYMMEDNGVSVEGMDSAEDVAEVLKKGFSKPAKGPAEQEAPARVAQQIQAPVKEPINAAAAETEPNPTPARAKAIESINTVVKPENKDGIGFYAVSGTEVQIDPDGADATITVTSYKSRFAGRAKETRENTKSLKFSEIGSELSPEARAAVEAEISERGADSTAVEAPAKAKRKPTAKRETLQKRPLIASVRSRIGKIDPDGPFGRELYARGVNAQTAPGLFRRGGLKDLDNIPATEHPDIAQQTGIAEDGLYLDQVRILDLIVNEVSGRPTPLNNQEMLQREAQAELDDAEMAAQAEIEAERIAGQGYQGEFGPGDRGDLFLPTPDKDPRSPDDRLSAIRAYIDDIIQRYSLPALTKQEYEDTVSQLEVAGGSVLAAIEQAFIRGELNGNRREEPAQTSSATDAAVSQPPFGPEDEARIDGSGVEGDRPEDRTGAGPSEGGGRPDGQGEYSPGSEQVSDDDATWWAGLGREAGPDNRAAYDILDVAGVAYSNLRRPWRDLKADDRTKIIAAKTEVESRTVGWDGKTYPATLEDVADKPRDGQRLNHIYAEYGGARFYLTGVSGNPDAAAAEWKKTYPKASIYTTDRADGTSINGGIAELEAKLAGAALPKVEQSSAATFANWIKSVPSTGRTRGWTVFNDTKIGGAWVLMSTDLRAGPFQTQEAARQWAQENPETGFDEVADGKPSAKAAPKKQTPKAARKEKLTRLRAYFAPGNIVKSYGGGVDRVIGFDETPDGDWSVRVEAVVKRNGEWVKDPSDDRIRTHRTTPEERELRNGPIMVAAPAQEAPAAPSFEPGADGKPQAVMPGMEGSADQAKQALTDRQRLELEARQKQQKMRRLGGNEGDAGPLFSDQIDLFSAPAQSSAETFASAAAEADPDPTPAQAEAGNYRKGHAPWQGLDLTIENEKGQERRGYDDAGNVTWRVKMPAHYGYVKRTTGADGEQVDFYMGPEPDSDVVVVVDQVDAETRAYDEHKVMLGFRNRKAALDTYVLGFSDGKGRDRLGAHKVMTVAEFKEWLESGDLTKPVRLGEADADSETDTQVASAKPAKIEDFGEKIGGARKDVWAGFKDRMKEAENLDIASEPLSKSWPEPDYEKLIESGVDAWTVAFMRAAREQIPRKPSKGWKLKGWVEQVELLRGFATKLMDGRIDPDRVKSVLPEKRQLNENLGTKVEAYLAVGHGKSLKDLNFGTATYSMLNQVRYNPSRTFWEVSKDAKATAFGNMPKTLLRADTKAELLEKFKKLHAQLDEDGGKKGTRDKGAKFIIYSMRSGDDTAYRVGVKIGKNYVDLRAGISDVKEARRIIAEEREQLQAQLDRMREIPNERRDENAPRIGSDHRNGANVTPQQFAEAFGFKGVEFGNWVEQSRRQQDLNDAYDALMDLASILDIPAKAISLNGSLGLAFGARGSGGKNPAAAHYEPGKMVINLTKRAGRGSLAHEWFHALDNYFARKRQPMRGNYITDNNSPGGQLTEGVRPETVDAFLAVKRAIMATDLPARSKRLDKLRSEPYFGTGIEMHARAFESYVIAKLQDQNASNDYLANTVSGVSWSMMADMAGLGDSYPYLKPDEIETVRPRIDELFRVMERVETDQGVAMEMRGFDDAADPDFAFATEIMQELAQVDDLFQNPRSDATTLEGVFGDIDPSVTQEGVLPKDDPRAESSDADRITMFRTQKGKPFYVHEAGKEVWIDVSDLGKGDGGSAIYSAVSEYALNTGKVFIGDPEGLSATALRRRTENMLSTALKHGTTRHIAPHQYQMEGDARLGVPPLAWTEGDDLANIQSLIAVSTASLINRFPQAQDARYDFQTRTFRTGDGKPLSDGALDRWVSDSGRGGAPSIGRRTLKRGILLNTLARAESGQKPGILEQSLRQPRQLVTGGGLSETFYMRAEREPVATLTGNELGEWSELPQLRKKAENWYRDNLSGTTAINAETGWEIVFAGSGAKKTVNGKGDTLLRIVPALRSIIENGTLIASYADNKSRAGIEAVHTFSAAVDLDGSVRDVVVQVRQGTDGKYYYNLSRDTSDGARFMVPEDVGTSEGIAANGQRPLPALEGNPDALNLEFAPDSRKTDPEVQEDDLRALTKALNGMPEMRGLEGRVTVKAVRRLVSHVTGNDILGRFTARDGIEVRAGRGAIGVMRHEIIHALRSEKLWNAPYGLFSGPEWRELVRAARAEPEIVRSVMARYKDQPPALQAEEMVAELYRLWAAQRDQYGPVAKSLMKIEGFLRALANALRGRGFVDAGRTMDQIASGRIGGRGPDGSGGGRRRGPDRSADDMEMRALPGTVRDKFAPLVGFRNWRNPSEWVSSFITDRMVSENASTLALVPGRPLFAEMGKSMLSAKAYLRTKEDMDALRNDWHAKSADVADEWTQMQSKDPRANEAMMDLMHRSTMTGVDPSKPDLWGRADNLLRSAKIEVSRLGDRAPDWAKQKVSDEQKRRRTYATVKQMYDDLPPEYRAFYVKVKNTYEALANEWDKALEENLQNAARIAMKNAERAHRQALRKIKDDGLTGAERDEAIAKADEDLKKAKARSQASAAGQIKSLRKIFESQRLKGPYFPLARFGKYFVTTRNGKGEVVSFSRMETEAQQRTHVSEMKEKYPNGKVTFGTIDAKTNMRDQVDPKFVAEVEAIVADSGADADVLDAIWQRYLQTLPDESIRTSKIHRKGREGFSRDALRAFSHHMFHGSHQLARLKYGLSLQEHVDDAREESRRAADPNRAGALVDEMQRRMEWTMNPQGASWVAAASSISFIWYLGVSPAAALVNLSQTTIIGPALMKARFQKASTGKILSELGRAAKDFGKGQGNVWTDTWSAENAETLTQAEKAAMAEGYRRGTIDKTQAYDLASVAESGVEYNPFREKWMRRIGWAFHHAERVNREVTYLANYRLARADGLSHEDAIDAASDLTWKIHFSYQNSDRARIMQRDWPKFFLQFRQYSVNALYRLFRDAHQSLNGATAAERKEARTQLIGISLSMMAHAGIKGVWGYGLIMGLLALFFPGDSDDLEDWMQDALLMEGDTAGVAAWNFAMGAALNGVPGQVTGASLVERIGMPNLWFREPNRDLEGTDLLQHYVNETLGPSVGILFSMARGAQYVTDGEVVRGVEAMTPKFVRDVIKSGRFAAEGVTTMNDDPILESVNPWELLLQANGFTPARVAERYDMNNRLKNREKEIIDERKGIHRAAGDAIKEGGQIPEKVLKQIRDFNARFPEYPITGDTIRQSLQGRMRASERNEYGVSLNPKLNDRLREALPTPVYN
jgi:hypothetical protein